MSAQFPAIPAKLPTGENSTQIQAFWTAENRIGFHGIT
jgi:hypothetical protein